MDRRSFLKAVTAAIGATFVPMGVAEAVSRLPVFVLADEAEFGDHVLVTVSNLTDQNHPVFVKAMELIRDQVRRTVPAGMPFLVTVQIGADKADPLNQITAIRWRAPAVRTPEREHYIGIFLS